MNQKPKTKTALSMSQHHHRSVASNWATCLIVVFIGHCIGQTLQAQTCGQLPFEVLAQESSESKLVPAEFESVERDRVEFESTSSPTIQNDLNQIDLSTAPRLSTPQLKPVPSRIAFNPNGSHSDATDQTWKLVQWTAPNDVYQNLIFEDPLLERHGINTGLTKFGLLRGERMQPVVSGLKFFTRGAIYPLEVLKRHHKRCDNPLGWGLPSTF